MTSESEINADILLALSRGSSRLFRANAGKAWQGDRAQIHKGILTLHNPRRIELMPAGTTDLIGWQSVTIRAEDVGKQVAVFVGIETKSADGRYRKGQRAFRRQVEKAGGMVGLARSIEDAKEIMGVE